MVPQGDPPPRLWNLPSPPASAVSPAHHAALFLSSARTDYLDFLKVSEPNDIFLIHSFSASNNQFVLCNLNDLKIVESTPPLWQLKPRTREIEWFSQNHTDGNWQIQGHERWAHAAWKQGSLCTLSESEGNSYYPRRAWEVLITFPPFHDSLLFFFLFFFLFRGCTKKNQLEFNTIKHTILGFLEDSQCCTTSNSPESQGIFMILQRLPILTMQSTPYLQSPSPANL